MRWSTKQMGENYFQKWVAFRLFSVYRSLAVYCIVAYLITLYIYVTNCSVDTVRGVKRVSEWVIRALSRSWQFCSLIATGTRFTTPNGLVSEQGRVCMWCIISIEITNTNTWISYCIYGCLYQLVVTVFHCQKAIEAVTHSTRTSLKLLLSLPAVVTSFPAKVLVVPLIKAPHNPELMGITGKSTCILI